MRPPLVMGQRGRSSTIENSVPGGRDTPTGTPKAASAMNAETALDDFVA
jgi:hypothetical protein